MDYLRLMMKYLHIQELHTNTFTGVVRGFSGISSYRTDLNAEELLFEETSQVEHEAGK